MKKVAVIMGSDSDWAVVKGACEQLKAFGIPFEAHILSAHRTPAAAAEFASAARSNGFGVLICAAGMAAHLAGAFAANSTLPVIGIPMKGGAGDGLDALLSTVQMPSGGNSGCQRRRPGCQAGRGPGGNGPSDRRKGSPSSGGAGALSPLSAGIRAVSNGIPAVPVILIQPQRSAPRRRPGNQKTGETQYGRFFWCNLQAGLCT